MGKESGVQVVDKRGKDRPAETLECGCSTEKPRCSDCLRCFDHCQCIKIEVALADQPAAEVPVDTEASAARAPMIPPDGAAQFIGIALYEVSDDAGQTTYDIDLQAFGDLTPEEKANLLLKALFGALTQESAALKEQIARFKGLITGFEIAMGKAGVTLAMGPDQLPMFVKAPKPSGLVQ